MKLRTYEGLHDLHAMLALLSEGCKAKNGSHYDHRGDLQWWLFYTDTPEEVWRPNIRLWMEGESLTGFALLSFEEKACDVFVRPELRGTQQEHELLSYALNEMSAVEDLQVMWISDQDDVRTRWLEQNGFAREEEHFVYFTRSLSRTVPAPVLPAGFSLRHSRGEADAKLRSMASHAAFSQHRDFEGYWPRTLKFMQSPVYVPEHEKFVISPSEEVASFCILWTDEINKLGHFEPVGTHPDHQRKGLGRALLYDAMKKLQSEGMTEEDVCTVSTNLPAIHLYESVGFCLMNRLLIFKKRKLKMDILEKMTKRVDLDPSLSLRSARWNDLEAVTKLIYDVCAADGDEVFAPSVEELSHEWKKDGFTLEKDAWVVTTSDGRVVGYEEFVNRHAHVSLQGDGYVAVEAMGKGVGTAMLLALEERAREEIPLAEPDLRVFIHNYMSMSDYDKVGREMHEHEGYKAIRYSWRMRIDLDAPPPMPEFPEGIELRPFNEAEHARLVWAADEEAFSDHWGHNPSSYEEWRENFIDNSNYDPKIWFIAWDGDQIAGHALCRYRAGIGWVRHLAVRRPWRKKGLGLALLYHCFNEFYKSGMPSIGLGVDASNPTGATRLYQKAGMKIAGEYVIYEKELRPGSDLEEEE